MREEMGGGWGPRFREESGSVGAAVRTWDAESWPRACQGDRGQGKDRGAEGRPEHRAVKCRPTAAWWPGQVRGLCQPCSLPLRPGVTGAALAGAGRRGEA